jgi:glycosyltransferase involved in cell wall biosynthesis
VAELRVGIDAWGLSGPLLYTGMGQFAYQLLRWLPRVAPEIKLTAYGAPDEGRPGWLGEDVAWRSPGRVLPAKFTALDSRLRALPPVARADQIDVFHAPAVHARPQFPPIARPGCQVVVTLHDVIPITHYDLRTLPLRQRLFYAWNLRRAAEADALVTVSEQSRAEICAVLKLPPQRVEVIVNAVEFPPNPSRASLDRLGIRSPYVLYAGSFEPRKNLVPALAAFARFAAGGRPESLVCIVERGSGHESGVKARIAHEGLGRRVTMVDSLSEDDLRALYTHAEVLMFPSLAEGFGFPPLQAAACGVPVLASDLPVLRATLDDAAVFVDPTDVDGLASGLTSILSDAVLMRRLKLRGQQRAAEFGPARFALAYRDLYRRVAAAAEVGRVRFGSSFQTSGRS